MWLNFDGAAIGYHGGEAVLENVSVRFGQGLWAVVGPNGSGKSSLLRAASGLLQPRSGRLAYDGKDAWAEPMAYRYLVGYAPQEMEELPDMTAGRYLAYLAALKGIRSAYQRPRAAEMLRQTGLPDQAMQTFSAGMKRRLALAAALLNDPEILVLDEPSSGLDPEEKIRLWIRLAHLASERIVLFSTHVPEEVDGMVNGWVLVADKGVHIHADHNRIPLQDLSGRSHRTV